MGLNGDERAAPLSGAGTMLRMIRDGEAVTRADLARRTGLARSTVSHRIEALLASRLVYEAGASVSSGGRRPTVLAFNEDAGVILAADLGATHTRVAVSNLGATLLGELTFDMDIAEGPEPVLTRTEECFAALLAEIGRTPADVRGIGLGVPGPVSFTGGQPVKPPIMPGWDGFSIPSWLAGPYDAPVLVDNDVNVMAFGEQRIHWRSVEHLLFVKVGTGIGCGIIASGRVHRGPQGAAGDIGHIHLSGHDEVICWCGNVGCLEAVAGGRALARRLAQAGHDVQDSRGVVRLAASGNTDAIRMVRESGRRLGEVLASCVSFFNPAVIVLGGDLAETHDQILAGVREVVFQRSLPLATRDLRIVRTRLGDRAGVIGAALMVIEHVLEPDAVDRAINVP